MATLKSDILKLHLKRYGFNQEFLDKFELSANGEIGNLSSLVEILYMVRHRGDKILMLSDFDGDGIMSGVIGYAGLSELGFNVELYHPIPADGYGIHIEDIDRILSMHPDCKIILTADVGVGENKAIRYAKANGLTVLVTDHHVGQTDCEAAVCVDPNARGDEFEHKGICGAYVLWRVLKAFADKYEGAVKINDIWRLRVFAGIATISDVMPLLYENRQLVRDAVSIARYYYKYELKDDGIAPPMYSHAYSMAFAGLTQLLHYFEEQGKLKSDEDINEHFFGFYLVPMLNSVKRMDGDMSALYDVFFGQCVHPTEDFPDMPCVDNAVKYVADLNEKRKLLVDDKFRELQEAIAAYERGDRSNPITKYADCNVYRMDIPGGICGLLAVKLMNVTGMPCIVTYQGDNGAWNGSGRCPDWFPFVDKVVEQTDAAKAACAANGDNVDTNWMNYLPDVRICNAAGHNPAFGVNFRDEADFEAYSKYYQQVIVPASSNISASDLTIHLSMVPFGTNFETDFSFEESIIDDFLDDERLLHPYGQAFPQVMFKMLVPADNLYAEFFGSLNNHVKFINCSDESVEFLWFNALVDFELLLKENTERKPFQLIGKFQRNAYNNALNFIISDVSIYED